MTPKEKAEQLVKKHLTAIAEESMDSDGILNYSAKQCALITIDELIIQNGELLLNGLGGDYYTSKNGYLFEVKSELEKL